MVNFHIRNVLGVGRYSSVFLSRYQNSSYATKFQVGRKEDFSQLRNISVREYQFQQILDDLGTVPVVYNIAPDYCGNPQRLGLDERFNTSSLLPHAVKDEDIQNPYFCSPLMMEFIPGATPLPEYGRPLPSSFFDSVEYTMHVAHDRGILLPSDLEGNILVDSKMRPLIIDFDFAVWFGELQGEDLERGVNGNYNLVGKLREKYEG